MTDFEKASSGIQHSVVVTTILKPFFSVRLTRQALSMIVHFTYQERGHWLDDAISLRALYMTTGSLVFYCFLCFLQNISEQTLLAGGVQGV